MRTYSKLNRQRFMVDWFWSHGYGVYVGQAFTFVWSLQDPSQEWRFGSLSWAYEIVTKKAARIMERVSA